MHDRHKDMIATKAKAELTRIMPQNAITPKIIILCSFLNSGTNMSGYFHKQKWARKHSTLWNEPFAGFTYAFWWPFKLKIKTMEIKAKGNEFAVLQVVLQDGYRARNQGMIGHGNEMHHITEKVHTCQHVRIAMFLGRYCWIIWNLHKE